MIPIESPPITSISAGIASASFFQFDFFDEEGGVGGEMVGCSGTIGGGENGIPDGDTCAGLSCADADCVGEGWTVPTFCTAKGSVVCVGSVFGISMCIAFKTDTLCIHYS
ncbi:MAG TPA: hypothetical protein DCX59_02955 [Candidatus Pacebacteria bacterium]|nr:hypothetical protein [Candidatus Paceibacterota bacterium]